MRAGRRTPLVTAVVVVFLAILAACAIAVAAPYRAVAASEVATPTIWAPPVAGTAEGGVLPMADDLDAPVVPASTVPTVGPARTLSAAPVVPMVFPIDLPKKPTWTDTWGAARSGGRSHLGNDIMVPKMTKLVAVVGGKVDWLNLTGKLSSYNGQPYYNLLLRGDDGNVYFYIHMNNDTPGTDDGRGGLANAYAPGLVDGTHVKAGQFIGYAGDSGNAEDSGSHLHFELHLGGYGNPVDPYSSLKAAPTWTEWQATHGGPPPPPPLPTFTDVRTSDWYYGDLALLWTIRAVRNTPDDRFRPYDDVTRAEFATFLVRALEAEEVTATVPPATSPFIDVPTDHPDYREIVTAARIGVVRGVGDGASFAPDASITRAQMAAMIARALALIDVSDEAAEVRPFPDVPQEYWAAQEIAAVKALALIKGKDDGDFHPEETCKRAHAVAVIARAVRLGDLPSGGDS